MYDEFDAFTADAAPDGLKSKDDIRIFICYIIANTPSKLTSDDILNVMCEQDLANYFEINEAVSDLIKLGNISKDEDGNLTLEKGGKIIADNLGSRLPVTVCRRANSAVSWLLTRRRNAQENEVNIIPHNSGYQVECRILDGDYELLKLVLYAPSKKFADDIRDNFLNCPEFIYRFVLARLTDDSSLIDL